jgi:hypothetical protein
MMVVWRMRAAGEVSVLTDASLDLDVNKETVNTFSKNDKVLFVTAMRSILEYISAVGGAKSLQSPPLLVTIGHVSV